MSGNPPSTNLNKCVRRPIRRFITRLLSLSFSFTLFERIEETEVAGCCSMFVSGDCNCSPICNGVDRDTVQQMIDTAVATSEERMNLQILGVTQRLDGQLLRIDEHHRALPYLERRVTTLETKQNSPGNIEISEGRRNMPFRFAIVGGLLGLLLTIVGGLSVPESIFQMIHGGTWVATKSLFWWLIYGLPLIGSGLVGGTALGVALMFRNGGKR